MVPNDMCYLSGLSCSKADLHNVNFLTHVLVSNFHERIWVVIVGLKSFILLKSKQYSKRIIYFFLKKLLLEFSLSPGLKLTGF